MEGEVNWIIKEVQEDLLRQVDVAPASAQLSPLVRRLLAQRGLSEPEAIDRFLSPRLSDLSDPFLMPDMQPAVDRLLKAIDENERVVLYGDYDVDGVTSVALIQEVLGKYGLECQGFLPHRMDEGYGVSKSGVERCLKDHDPQLIIAVDCGTTSIEEVAYLKEHAVDVVICDHHECSQDGRPDCVALVNPKVGDEYHYLCSAGVVFKVAHALLKTRPNPALDLKDYLDIVALGTVADIVPLVSENRILVRKGLHRLRKTDNCGLVALKRETKLGERIQTSDIGFRLGPRLNAAGRLHTAQSALDLLLERDPAEAKSIAQKLDQQNRERQELEYRMYDEALAMIEKGPHPRDRCSIVLGSDDWHPGVVGIVASRLMRRYHRPTFVVAFDETGLGKGSGRSVEKISLVSALNSCDDLLIKGGGHEMAAGLSIWKQNFPDFQQRFEEIVAANARSEYLIPTLYVDAEVQLTELTLSLLDSYEMMEPFGSHNPQPTLLCRNVSLAGDPITISNKHLRLELYQNGTIRDAVYFGAAELELSAPPWDVAFTIQRNEYRGRESLQIHVTNVRSSQ
ncbi:single-stranded-DNA-specific exonuclease RecJ [bacterium]|jgi:single-stranded-DNA-specific exonuclease|nr:single-stranded-DNA-specific exonuclease RecJ [bacterium]MDC3255142.1 single-stranded-DNA-specific exonuclease RecJ [bacterium]MDF1786384.1 single-stranded-DNA-specific exonuclease RecJ [Verrucomicrobiales bacterium]